MLNSYIKPYINTLHLCTADLSSKHLARRLNNVLDAAGGASSINDSRVNSLESSGLKRTLDVEVVVDGAQSTACAADDNLSSVVGLQRSKDLVASVGLGAGGDASSLEPVIGGQGLEERNNLVEVVNNLVTCVVVAVAAWLQGADAGSVGVPLVLPEGFGGLVVALPVGLHVGEEIILTGIREDVGDARVVSALVAVLGVGTITPIGP